MEFYCVDIIEVFYSLIKVKVNPKRFEYHNIQFYFLSLKKYNHQENVKPLIELSF